MTVHFLGFIEKIKDVVLEKVILITQGTALQICCKEHDVPYIRF